MLKLKSLNPAKLLSLGKCIFIRRRRYPLAPRCLDKARHAHSRRGWHLRGSPSKDVAHSSHFPGGTLLGMSVLSLLTVPSSQTLTASSFGSQRKTVLKEKTWPHLHAGRNSSQTWLLKRFAAMLCIQHRPAPHFSKLLTALLPLHWALWQPLIPLHLRATFPALFIHILPQSKEMPQSGMLATSSMGLNTMRHDETLRIHEGIAKLNPPLTFHSEISRRKGLSLFSLS